MPARHLLALLGKALVAHAWLGGTSAPSLPPPPQPPPDCWFMGKKVEPELCILPPPPVPSPPPPPPPTPFPPPQNSTGYLPETGDDLHARNVMYVGGCVSALAVTGMVGAYAYSQVDEPTSTAGAAARSFKAAVTGVCAPPVTNPLRAHLLPFAARSTCGSREGRGAKVESQRGACTAVALPPLRGHF